jgi:RNA polymerase primary sigma factor
MATNTQTKMTKDTSIRLYLEEIGQTPLLTAQEEAQLATKIQATKDEPSRQLLMRANLRLVVSIAKQYAIPRDSESLLDLIQEGNIGLMRAVDRFRPEFKTRFSTYGVYWIRQAVLRALKSRRMVRLPENVVDQVMKMRRTRQSLYQILGRWPTPEELAGEMELPLKTIRMLEEAGSDVVSLDQPVRGKEGEEETQLSELIEDTEALSPNQITQREIVRSEIRSAVGSLPPREKKILELRFGLGDKRPFTLEEIGENFGISRERVRQLQNVALARLRKRKSMQQVRA